MNQNYRSNHPIISSIPRRQYNKLSLEIKKLLFEEVFENWSSIRQAAIKLGINNSTAKLAIRKYRREQQKKKKLANNRRVIEIDNNSQSNNQNPSTNTMELYPVYMYYVAPDPFSMTFEPLIYSPNVWMHLF